MLRVFEFQICAKPLVGLLLLWAVSGCASKERIAPGGRYVVTVRQAAFYKYGPAQTFGADFQLREGELVTMMERSYGFSRVQTESGVIGYVANEELKPGPPPAPQAKVPTKTRSSSRPISSAPGVPLFDTSDLPTPPLPESDPAPAKP